MYLAYMLAFIDRQIIAFLVGPIREDLQISDFQFSLIHGLAFVIFYATLGIPIGILADTYNRKKIITIGISLWSLMTALCGLAGNYWQLFLTRLGVGVGEATLSPSAVSILADYFPPHKRSIAINLYSAGVHGGIGGTWARIPKRMRLCKTDESVRFRRRAISLSMAVPKRLSSRLVHGCAGGSG